MEEIEAISKLTRPHTWGRLRLANVEGNGDVFWWRYLVNAILNVDLDMVFFNKYTSFCSITSWMTCGQLMQTPTLARSMQSRVHDGTKSRLQWNHTMFTNHGTWMPHVALPTWCIVSIKKLLCYVMVAISTIFDIYGVGMALMGNKCGIGVWGCIVSTLGVFKVLGNRVSLDLAFKCVEDVCCNNKLYVHIIICSIHFLFQDGV